MNEQQDKTRLLLDGGSKDGKPPAPGGERNQETRPSSEDQWKRLLTTLDNVDTVAQRLIATIILLGATIDVLVTVVIHLQKAITIT